MCKTNQNTLKPEIIVEPNEHLLVDDELQISIRGLDRLQNVTIHAVLDVSGKSVESCCHFEANEYGVVDLYGHPSLSGSYTGISPMGIFWSMTPTPEMPKGFLFSVKDVDEPLATKIDLYNGTLTVDDIRLQNPSPLATHFVERWCKSEDVKCVEVTDGRLRGKLFLPPGSGPFPGVIDLNGTAGGLMELRSALLASRGFASFVLPYIMYKDLPKHLYDIDLDYFLEAVSWLLTHPSVYGTGVGVVGVSKGADIGFMMAANCSKVRAIVNINGCTFNAGFRMKYSGGDIPCVQMDLGKLERREGAWITTNTFPYKKKDLTPVWRHNPKVLNIMSEDDLCGPKECIPFMEKHYPADKKDNFVVLRYPDAGHLIEPPYTPSSRMSYHKPFGNPGMLENLRPISLLNIDYKISTRVLAQRLQKVLPNVISLDQQGYIKNRFIGYNIRQIQDIIDYAEALKIEDMFFLWGGRPQPHAHAQEDSWKKILDFLHTNIPKIQPLSSKL